MRAAAALVVAVVMSPTALGATSLLEARPLGVPVESENAVRATAVIDSFPAPGIEPMGLDWAEEMGVMYHVDQVRGDVYSITPEGAATLLFNVLEQVGYPESLSCGNGICFVPSGYAGDLYITDFEGHKDDAGIDRVYRFGLDGTLLGSWNVEAVADQVVGICFDGVSFWLTRFGGTVVKCNAGFEEIASYALLGYAGGGIDYDPVEGRFYLVDYVSGAIRVCDEEMNVLGVFYGHAPAVYMIGVTVGRTTRGRSMWTSTYDEPDRPATPSIFEIDDEFYTPVEESSWGRIKAAYR